MIVKNHKTYYIMSVVAVLLAYLANPYLWNHAFYHLTALSFCLIHYSQYLQSKGNYSLFVFVVFMVTINNLLDEVFFDPKKMDYNEIITALIIVVIVWKFKNKWRND
jgi:hypothetical protein